MGINGSFVYVAVPKGESADDVGQHIDAHWRTAGFASTRHTKIDLETSERDDRWFGVAVSPIVAGWCAVFQSDRAADYGLARHLSRKLGTTVLIDSVYDIVNFSRRYTLRAGQLKPNQTRLRRGLESLPYATYFYQDADSSFVYRGGLDDAPHDYPGGGSRSRVHESFVYLRTERVTQVVRGVKAWMRERGAALVLQAHLSLDDWKDDSRLLGVWVSPSNNGWVVVCLTDPTTAIPIARFLSKENQTLAVVDQIGYGVRQLGFAKGRACVPTRRRRAGLERCSFWEPDGETRIRKTTGLVFRDQEPRDFARLDAPPGPEGDDIPF